MTAEDKQTLKNVYRLLSGATDLSALSPDAAFDLFLNFCGEAGFDVPTDATSRAAYRVLFDQFK